MMRKVIVLLLLIGISGGCEFSEDRAMRQLEGRWRIDQSVRVQINNDGSTETYEDLEDAGYIEFSESPQYTAGLKDVVMEYTNFLGQAVTYTGIAYNDEGNLRLGFAGFFCSSVFNCDLVWNIEQDRGRKQVWTFYFNDQPGRNQYGPGNAAVHYKWTVTLRKEGL